MKRTMSKKELLNLFDEFNCSCNKKFLCAKFDFINLKQQENYYNDYSKFVYSLENIDIIYVYFEFNRHDKIKQIEINIACNVDKYRDDYEWLEYTGQLYRFKLY